MQDPSTDIGAFARLVALRTEPFPREPGMDERQWSLLEERWARRLTADPALVASFERHFRDARGGASGEGTHVPIDSSETMAVVADEATRKALLTPPLPFRAGAYTPPSSPAVPRPAPQTVGEESEATILPSDEVSAALPFKAPDWSER